MPSGVVARYWERFCRMGHHPALDGEHADRKGRRGDTVRACTAPRGVYGAGVQCDHQSAQAPVFGTARRARVARPTLVPVRRRGGRPPGARWPPTCPRGAASPPPDGDAWLGWGIADHRCHIARPSHAAGTRHRLAVSGRTARAPRVGPGVHRRFGPRGYAVEQLSSPLQRSHLNLGRGDCRPWASRPVRRRSAGKSPPAEGLGCPANGDDPLRPAAGSHVCYSRPRARITGSTSESSDLRFIANTSLANV